MFTKVTPIANDLLSPFLLYMNLLYDFEIVFVSILFMELPPPEPNEFKLTSSVNKVVILIIQTQLPLDLLHEYWTFPIDVLMNSRQTC